MDVPPVTPKVKGKLGGNVALQNKVSKFLQNNLESDKEVIEALKSLSLVMGENTPDARRGLRSLIEKQTLDVNQEFLASFADVKKNLETLHSEVTSIKDTCQSMLDRIKSCRTENTSFVEEVTTLQDKLTNIDVQEKEARKLIEKYTEAVESAAKTEHRNVRSSLSSSSHDWV